MVSTRPAPRKPPSWACFSFAAPPFAATRRLLRLLLLSLPSLLSLLPLLPPAVAAAVASFRRPRPRRLAVGVVISVEVTIGTNLLVHVLPSSCLNLGRLGLRGSWRGLSLLLFVFPGTSSCCGRRVVFNTRTSSWLALRGSRLRCPAALLPLGYVLVVVDEGAPDQGQTRAPTTERKRASPSPPP
jgi:hypothetical protein